MAGPETLTRSIPVEAPDLLAREGILPEIKRPSDINVEGIVTYANAYGKIVEEKGPYADVDPDAFTAREKDLNELRMNMMPLGLSEKDLKVGQALYGVIKSAEHFTRSHLVEPLQVRQSGIDPTTGRYMTRQVAGNPQEYGDNKNSLEKNLETLQNQAAEAGYGRENVVTLLLQMKQDDKDTLEQQKELRKPLEEQARRRIRQENPDLPDDEINTKVNAAVDDIMNAKVAERMHAEHAQGHEQGKIDDYWEKRKAIRKRYHPTSSEKQLEQKEGWLDDWINSFWGVGRTKDATNPWKTGREIVPNPDSSLRFHPLYALRHAQAVKERRATLAWAEKTIEENKNYITTEEAAEIDHRIESNEILINMAQNRNWRLPEEPKEGLRRGFIEKRQEALVRPENILKGTGLLLDNWELGKPSPGASETMVHNKLQQVRSMLDTNSYLLDGDPAKNKLIEKHALASARLIDRLFRAGTPPSGIEPYQYEERNNGKLLYNDIGYKVLDSNGDPIGVFWADGSRASWDADKKISGERLTATGRPFTRPSDFSPLIHDRRRKTPLEEASKNALSGKKDKLLQEYDKTRTPQALENAWHACVNQADLLENQAEEAAAELAYLERIFGGDVTGGDAQSRRDRRDRAEDDLQNALQNLITTKREQALLEANRHGREIKEVDLGLVAAGLAITTRLREPGIIESRRHAEINKDDRLLTWDNASLLVINEQEELEKVTGEWKFHPNGRLSVFSSTGRMVYSTDGRFLSGINFL